MEQPISYRAKTNGPTRGPGERHARPRARSANHNGCTVNASSPRCDPALSPADARRQGPGQHLARQLRLGRKAPILRNPRPLAAGRIVGPLLGQVELAVQQGLAEPAGIPQKNPDLAGGLPQARDPQRDLLPAPHRLCLAPTAPRLAPVAHRLLLLLAVAEGRHLVGDA
jgi:hypothetical protein